MSISREVVVEEYKKYLVIPENANQRRKLSECLVLIQTVLRNDYYSSRLNAALELVSPDLSVLDRFNAAMFLSMSDPRYGYKPDVDFQERNVR